MAKPMGSQRAFMSIPAVIAATRAATGGEDAERSELGRAREHEDRHGDRRHRAHDGPCQHAEGHPEGERREHERQSGAHSRADVAVFVHLGYLTCLRLQVVRQAEGSVTPETIKLWGGSLCLDFANSVDWSPAGDPLSPHDGCAAERAGAGALGPPARRGARAPAAGRERRRAEGHARLAARAAPHLLGARAGSPPGAGRPRRARPRPCRGGGAAALAAADDGAWRLDWPARRPAARPLRGRGRRRRAARRPGPPRARAPLPGPVVRLAVPRHQRPAAVVLDDDVRQPGQDAPPLRAPATGRTAHLAR